MKHSSSQLIFLVYAKMPYIRAPILQVVIRRQYGNGSIGKPRLPTTFCGKPMSIMQSIQRVTCIHIKGLLQRTWFHARVSRYNLKKEENFMGCPRKAATLLKPSRQGKDRSTNKMTKANQKKSRKNDRVRRSCIARAARNTVQSKNTLEFVRQ